MNRLTQYMFKIDVEGRLPDSLWLGAKSELEWQFLRMSKNVNVSCLFHRCLWSSLFSWLIVSKTLKFLWCYFPPPHFLMSPGPLPENKWL